MVEHVTNSDVIEVKSMTVDLRTGGKEFQYGIVAVFIRSQVYCNLFPGTTATEILHIYIPQTCTVLKILVYLNP